jgi:hypothetical protein
MAEKIVLATAFHERWVAKLWRWGAKLVGRWVANLVGRRVAKLVGQWVAKLVARLLVTASSLSSNPNIPQNL